MAGVEKHKRWAFASYITWKHLLKYIYNVWLACFSLGSALAPPYPACITMMMLGTQRVMLLTEVSKHFICFFL